MKAKKRPKRFFVHIFVLPFAIAMIVPFIVFDLCISIYHRIAFTICGMKRVKRKPNFKIDEHKIALLNKKERFFAVLILYASGVINYAKKIISESEQYWCQPRSIKGGQLVTNKNKIGKMQMMMMQQQMAQKKPKKKKK
ncbi:MAG: hypothetical protein S4CHLAM7_14960 [Chlamydiae bacterium]|nr:hypothetical protein [Chlamydiota bacterium]